ncbi:hypothetical protein BDZ89DRAFT_1048843 [Hymenopellis radicata]|nr:hypothetical protein BDZ89DRAFT_1048843 [Hymenopellis radicata]
MNQLVFILLALMVGGVWSELKNIEESVAAHPERLQGGLTTRSVFTFPRYDYARKLGPVQCHDEVGKESPRIHIVLTGHEGTTATRPSIHPDPRSELEKAREVGTSPKGYTTQFLEICGQNAGAAAVQRTSRSMLNGDTSFTPDLSLQDVDTGRNVQRHEQESLNSSRTGF